MTDIAAAFLHHTLLPLDDRHGSLPASNPHLARSSRHRCLEGHGTGSFPGVDGDEPARKGLELGPIGFFHIDIAGLRIEEGKLFMLVAIDDQTVIDPISERDAASRPRR